MSIDDRAPFSTMSEWMDMSGIIWDIIIKYQDIVKYRNVEELTCSNILKALASELMRKNIYSNQEIFEVITEKLIFEINEIDTLDHPSAVLTDIKLSESMKKFQEAIVKNVDRYLVLNFEDKKMTFNEMWLECFGAEDPREGEIERDENFDNLYSIFKMELRTMESRSAMYELFRNSNFIMDDVINSIQSKLISSFQSQTYQPLVGNSLDLHLKIPG